MDNDVKLITIDIEEEDGLFYATSPDVPEIMLAHQDISVVIEQIPIALSMIYEHKFGQPVSVRPATTSEKRHALPMHRPWAVIPCEPLAQAHA